MLWAFELEMFISQVNSVCDRHRPNNGNEQTESSHLSGEQRQACDFNHGFCQHAIDVHS
jgi:hypothetical protein